MQVPLQVTYQHMKPSPALDAMIREKLTKLERIYNRITACRVVVGASTKPHRQYHVRIDLSVPGSEIVVKREPEEQDEALELGIVLRDSFEAARRQLDDFARKQRGEAKIHA